MMNPSVTPALEKVWVGLPHMNFIVEGPNVKVCRLFTIELKNLIQKENREYSFFVVQVNMEGMSDQEFFQIVGTRFLQEIKDKYSCIDVVWDEKSTIADFLKFEEIVKDAISVIKDIDQQPTRIVFLLSSADAMNNLHIRVKAALRSVLDDLSPEVTAVIVAQKIDYTDSSKWVGSPWFSTFVRVRLE
jgi:hypothetical protein